MVALEPNPREPCEMQGLFPLAETEELQVDHHTQLQHLETYQESSRATLG